MGLDVMVISAVIGLIISALAICLFKTMSLVKQLYDLHNVKDADGVPVWYNRQSLVVAIESLAESAKQQTRLIEQLVVSYDRINKHLDKIEINTGD